MKKVIIKIISILIICWLVLVSADGFRLIGSEDPGKYPLLNLGGIQYADKIAKYDSIGFSQIYNLTDGDVFVSGEFKVLGITIAHWE